MENLTHSLIGATLAELALPRDATPSQRTFFFASGIIAANLPDADLVYTSITPAPLGYLLHHRGHTHTIVGLAGLAACIGLVTMIPVLRRLWQPSAARYWTLIFAALASHLIADAWNSYGVHPFWPLDNRWFYGDAIYILEPWLWTLLGVSVVMNTRSHRGRLIVSALLVIAMSAVVWMGMVSAIALVPLVVAGALLVARLRARPPRVRAWASLTLAALFVVSSATVSRGMRDAATLSLAKPPHRHLVDVVLNPRPANPLCWTALAIEEANDSLYLRRRNLPFGASVFGFDACGKSSTEWAPVATQSLAELRGEVVSNCRVRAWLQFGRAPVIADGWIADARFGGTGRGNFTAMPVGSNGTNDACPANLTVWDMPRADVLARLPTAP